MTEEQIKNLKAGDKFTIEYEVLGNEDRFITVAITYQGGTWTDAMGRKGNQLKTATLITPPHTFEVGDTVRIVPDPLTGHVHGRENWTWEEDKNCVGKITSFDANNCQATVYREGRHGWGATIISLHCLELVKKAVKDKYIVRKIRDGWGVARIEEDNFKRSCAEFVEETHPNAKAAAMAECARLNKRWRRQQESAAVCDGGVTKGGAE